MKHLKYLTFFAFLFACCKGTKVKTPTQYPEDPGPSTISATERLINKKWVLTSATVNGIEFIDSVHNKIGECSFKFQNVKANLSPLIAPEDALIGETNSDSIGSNFMVWAIGDKEEAIWSHDFDMFGNIGGKSNNYPDFILVPTCFINIESFVFTARVFIRKLTQFELKVQAINSKGDSTFVNVFETK